MYDLLKDGDLIITNNKINILNYLNKNKKMINLKIMTLNEFKDKYFGYYDARAIYYLINKYHYKYDVAISYLKNFQFLSLKEELEKNNLIIKEPLFKKSISRIIIDCDIDPYIKKEIEKYDYQFLNFNKEVTYPVVYEFNEIEDEVNFVALEILKLVDNVELNKIFLCCNSEYFKYIKRIFNFYNIPVNFNERKKVYGLKPVQKFVKYLNETYDLESSIRLLENSDISKAVVDICNKYQFKDLDETIVYCITEELKKLTIGCEKYASAVNVVDINSIEDDNYYFVLGFNQGLFPKIYKDEDFFTDNEKKQFGIFTSIEKNELENLKISNLIKSKNVVVTYKLNSKKDNYYKSPLIDRLNLKVKKVHNKDYSYSDLYNKLELSKRLDNLIKYNVYDKDINLLYSNYSQIPYLNYKNDYTKIEKNSFFKYINDDLLLSYSSINNFYHCSFRYYIENILKLNKYEDNFMQYVGNMFHYVLSKAFADNFDFEKVFSEYNDGKEFNNKEKFFIEKLKKDLSFTINVIKEQDKYTSLNDALYEKKIYVDKSDRIKITFMGVIDKMKYKQYDGKYIVAIIDYKTGDPYIDLNNLPYGINMQLPIYLYLSKNYDFEKVEIAGIYLQKILHNKFNYNNKDYMAELEKLYRLEGFSNSDIDILSKFDSSYDDSKIIKSMKLSKNGFYNYCKVLNNSQIDKVYNIVDNKIDEAIKNILDVDFSINPKRIGNDLIGCEFCKFKDICYRKDEDIINLKPLNYNEILGGEENA